MTLQDAFDLFRRLGVQPEMMSRADFSAAYYRLARRFHPDVMAWTAPPLAVAGAITHDCAGNSKEVTCPILP